MGNLGTTELSLDTIMTAQLGLLKHNSMKQFGPNWPLTNGPKYHVIIFIQEWIAYRLISTGMVSSLLLTSS